MPTPAEISRPHEQVPGTGAWVNASSLAVVPYDERWSILFGRIAQRPRDVLSETSKVGTIIDDNKQEQPVLPAINDRVLRAHGLIR